MSPINNLRSLLRDAGVLFAQRCNRHGWRRDPAQVGENICVFSGMPNPGLGDLVRKSHFYWAIRQARPGARLTLFESNYIVERFAGFFADHAHIHEVVPWPDPGTIGWHAPWRRLWKLRRWRFDTCVIEPLSTSFRPLDAVLAGITDIVALPHSDWSAQESRIVNRPLTPSNPQPDLYEMAETLCRALDNARAVSRAGFPPRLPVQCNDSNRLDPDRLHIALHPGGEKRWPRRWPRDNYVALCLHLANLPGYAVAIVGGAEEHAEAESIRAEVLAAKPSARLLNVCGGSLNDLAATLDQCRLFVGNDSGPLHVAGALGTGAVAILGPSVQIDPIVRAVYKNYRAVIGKCHCVVTGNHEEFACDSYQESQGLLHPHCLSLVTVPQVIAAVDSMLAAVDRAALTVDGVSQ